MYNHKSAIVHFSGVYSVDTLKVIEGKVTGVVHSSFHQKRFLEEIRELV